MRVIMANGLVGKSDPKAHDLWCEGLHCVVKDLRSRCGVLMQKMYKPRLVALFKCERTFVNCHRGKLLAYLLAWYNFIVFK